MQRDRGRPYKCDSPGGVELAITSTNRVLHSLQEEPVVEDTARTPRIYAALDGQQADYEVL